MWKRVEERVKKNLFLYYCNIVIERRQTWKFTEPFVCGGGGGGGVGELFIFFVASGLRHSKMMSKARANLFGQYQVQIYPNNSPF